MKLKKTTEISKVLIALDYDPTAEKVAEEGYSFAKRMNAEVTLLHVMADPLYYSLSGHVTVMGFAGFKKKNTDKKESENSLLIASQHFLDKSKEHLGDNDIETLVMEGDFAKSILEAANTLKVDVIVIGTHSRKWLESIVMGSVAKEVLLKTSIPILIIPTKKQV